MYGRRPHSLYLSVMKERNTRSSTRRLTWLAMLCALSVAFMYLGNLLDVLEISAVAIASLFMLFCVHEMGYAAAWMLYAATAVLTLLLVPSKGVGGLYLLFGGLYPLIKFPLERIPRPWPIVLKLIYMAAVITAVECATVFLFLLPFEGWTLLVLLYVIALPTFVMYDILLSRLLVLYEVRIRPRIARFL